MRRFVFLIALLNSSNLPASGFDDMILWQYDISADSSKVMNTEPSRICRRGLEASFLHTKPYGINSLDWNYVMARYGFGRLGLIGQFGSYGLDGYYSRYIYSIGGAIKVSESFFSAVSGNFRTEDFNRAGKYFTADLSIRCSYKYNGLTGIAGLSGINLKSAYETYSGTSMRPWAGISHIFNNGIQLYASIKKVRNDRTRWLFGQFIDISDAVDIHIGILNRPNVFFGRLDLSYKSFTFVLTYNSVSRLNDTIVLGLAAGS